MKIVGNFGYKTLNFLFLIVFLHYNNTPTRCLCHSFL